jgi:hypothetical protein
MAIAHLTGWVKWVKNDKIPSDDKSWLIRNGPNHNYIVDAITTNNLQVNEVHTTTRLNQRISTIHISWWRQVPVQWSIEVRSMWDEKWCVESIWHSYWFDLP